MKKGKGQIPIKNNSGDDRLRATEKYGHITRQAEHTLCLLNQRIREAIK